MDRPGTQAIWNENAPAWIALSRSGRPGHRGLLHRGLASAALAAQHPEVAGTRIVPYFLIIRARKPPDRGPA